MLKPKLNERVLSELKFNANPNFQQFKLAKVLAGLEVQNYNTFASIRNLVIN